MSTPPRLLSLLVALAGLSAWPAQARALTGVVARQGNPGAFSLAGACRLAAEAWDGPFTAFAEGQTEWVDRNLARAWAAKAVTPLLDPDPNRS